MSNEKYMQFVASFLIVLVLTIPFYTTSAYAGIGTVSVKGSDNIQGFAREEDFINLEAQASIAGDTITPEQIVVGADPGIQFDKCDALSNGSFLCTLRYPSSGTELFDATSFPVTINLYRDDKTLDDSKQSSLAIDNKPPEVKLTIPKSKFSSGQNINITYSIADFACDEPSCGGKCAGIKSIEFFTLDSSLSQKVDISSSECIYSSNISINSGVFDDGLNSVFAKATDKFSQVSDDASATFTIDNTPPLALPGTFGIFVKDIAISTYSSVGSDAVVAVNISGDDLSLSSVTADLSALNPSQALKNAKASCTLQGGTSACAWAVELKPGTGGFKNIIINASDKSGNKGSVTITKLLSLDEEGPVLQLLSTSTLADGQLIGKASGNVVTAVFDDSTGLSPEDAILVVDGAKLKASNCIQESGWTCIWEDVRFRPVSTISIGSDTTDLLGNSVAEETQLEVKLDQDAPQLKSMNITNVGGLAQAFAGFFKIGDKIAVVANVTEDNDVFVSADFSSFISDASDAKGECEKIQADENICIWLTDPINLEASDFITFNFSDNAGNTLIVTKSLKTYGLENATVPNFWTSEAECSPETIDRQLGPLINQRVFCEVDLSQKSATKAVSTVFIGSASCSGDTSIVDSVDTFNTEPGSTSPVIKITLKKDDFKLSNASLSCSFNIFSKIGSGTDITRNPEIETAKINLLFSNLPLGEVSSEIQRKIKDAKDDAEGIFKAISSLNKFFTIAKKICQLFATLYNIITVMYTITVLLGIFTDNCYKGGLPIIGIPVCTAAYNAKTAQCGAQQAGEEAAQNAFIDFGVKACKFVNCQWAPWVLGYWQNNVKGMINSLPGAKYLPTPSPEYVSGGEGKYSLGGQVKVGDQIKGGFAEYMNPQRNLIVATLFACIPGIIYGLDKYRQIKCLYADCLENAVAQDGLPVTACEDLKAFSTCKYVYGELFALIPYTAVFDHFTGIIKDALSNPFSALGVGVALLCKTTCPAPAPTSTAVFTACEGWRLLAKTGEVIGNVKNIIDEGFKVREDYCSRLDLKDKSKPKKTTGDSGFTPVKTKK